MTRLQFVGVATAWVLLSVRLQLTGSGFIIAGASDCNYSGWKYVSRRLELGQHDLEWAVENIVTDEWDCEQTTPLDPYGQRRLTQRTWSKVLEETQDEGFVPFLDEFELNSNKEHMVIFSGKVAVEAQIPHLLQLDVSNEQNALIYAAAVVFVNGKKVGEITEPGPVQLSLAEPMETPDIVTVVAMFGNSQEGTVFSLRWSLDQFSGPVGEGNLCSAFYNPASPQGIVPADIILLPAWQFESNEFEWEPSPPDRVTEITANNFKPDTQVLGTISFVQMESSSGNFGAPLDGMAYPPPPYPKERYHVRLSGYFSVEEDGEYELILGSDDGSMVAVESGGDGLVMETDPLPPVQATWQHRLMRCQGYFSRGLHPIEVQYFQWEAGATLEVLFRKLDAWADPSMVMTRLLDANFILHLPQQPKQTLALFLHSPEQDARAQIEVGEAVNFPTEVISVVVSFRTTDAAPATILSYTDDHISGIRVFIEEDGHVYASVGLMTVVSDGPVTDGEWHNLLVSYGPLPSNGRRDRQLRATITHSLFMCLSRETEGQPPLETSFAVGSEMDIPSHGCLVLGQQTVSAEQPFKCGSTTEPQSSYEGYIRGLTIWRKLVTTEKEASPFLSSPETEVARARLSPAWTTDSDLFLALLGGTWNASEAEEQLSSEDFGRLSCEPLDCHPSDVVMWLDEGPNELHAKLLGRVRPAMVDSETMEAVETDVSQLAAWYTFDVETVEFAPESDALAIVQDRSGNGNNGVLTPMPLENTDLEEFPSIGTASGSRSLSVINLCWNGYLTVPGLANQSWAEVEDGDDSVARGFAASIYFRRSVTLGNQNLIGMGNVSSPGLPESWRVRLPVTFGGQTVEGSIREEGVRTDMPQDAHWEQRLPSHWRREMIATAPVRDDEFHHVLLSYDSDMEEASWFVNGKQTTIYAPNFMSPLGLPLWIGLPSRDPRGRGDSTGFCGQIHDVRLFRRPLDRQQARALWTELNHRYYFPEVEGGGGVCNLSDWSTAAPLCVDSKIPTIPRIRIRRRTGDGVCPPLQEVTSCRYIGWTLQSPVPRAVLAATAPLSPPLMSSLSIGSIREPFQDFYDSNPELEEFDFIAEAPLQLAETLPVPQFPPYFPDQLDVEVHLALLVCVLAASNRGQVAPAVSACEFGMENAIGRSNDGAAQLAFQDSTMDGSVFIAQEYHVFRGDPNPPPPVNITSLLLQRRLPTQTGPALDSRVTIEFAWVSDVRYLDQLQPHDFVYLSSAPSRSTRATIRLFPIPPPKLDVRTPPGVTLKSKTSLGLLAPALEGLQVAHPQAGMEHFFCSLHGEDGEAGETVGLHQFQPCTDLSLDMPARRSNEMRVSMQSVYQVFLAESDWEPFYSLNRSYYMFPMESLAVPEASLVGGDTLPGEIFSDWWRTPITELNNRLDGVIVHLGEPEVMPSDAPNEPTRFRADAEKIVFDGMSLFEGVIRDGVWPCIEDEEVNSDAVLLGEWTQLPATELDPTLSPADWEKQLQSRSLNLSEQTSRLFDDPSYGHTLGTTIRSTCFNETIHSHDPTSMLPLSHWVKDAPSSLLFLGGVVLADGAEMHVELSEPLDWAMEQFLKEKGIPLGMLEPGLYSFSWQSVPHPGRAQRPLPGPVAVERIPDLLVPSSTKTVQFAWVVQVPPPVVVHKDNPSIPRDPLCGELVTPEGDSHSLNGTIPAKFAPYPCHLADAEDYLLTMSPWELHLHRRLRVVSSEMLVGVPGSEYVDTTLEPDTEHSDMAVWWAKASSAEAFDIWRSSIRRLGQWVVRVVASSDVPLHFPSYPSDEELWFSSVIGVEHPRAMVHRWVESDSEAGDPTESFEASDRSNWVLDGPISISFKPALGRDLQPKYRALVNEYLSLRRGIRWDWKKDNPVSVESDSYFETHVSVLCHVSWTPFGADGAVSNDDTDYDSFSDFLTIGRVGFVANSSKSERVLAVCGGHVSGLESPEPMIGEVRGDSPGEMRIRAWTVVYSEYQGGFVEIDRVVRSRALDANIHIVRSLPRSRVWNSEFRPLSTRPSADEPVTRAPILTSNSPQVRWHVAMEIPRFPEFSVPPSLRPARHDQVALRCVFGSGSAVNVVADVSPEPADEPAADSPVGLAWHRAETVITVGLATSDATVRSDVSLSGLTSLPQAHDVNVTCSEVLSGGGYGAVVSHRITLVPIMRPLWADLLPGTLVTGDSNATAVGDGDRYRWSSSWLWDEEPHGREEMPIPADDSMSAARSQWRRLVALSSHAHPRLIFPNEVDNLPQTISFVAQMFPGQAVAIVCYGLSRSDRMAASACVAPGVRVFLQGTEVEVLSISPEWNGLVFIVPAFDTLCGRSAGSSRERCPPLTLELRNEAVLSDASHERIQPLLTRTIGDRGATPRVCLDSAMDLARVHLEGGGNASVLLGGCTVFPGHLPVPRRVSATSTSSGVARRLSAGTTELLALPNLQGYPVRVTMSGSVTMVDWCTEFAAPSADCLRPGANCGFGEGSACRLCPEGAVCPGGFRAWPLPGYWTPREDSGRILRCPPPATNRCLGWDRVQGRSVCGEGYGPNSEACSGCRDGYYPGGDGCRACPASDSIWLLVEPILYLVAGVSAIALFMVLSVVLTMWWKGGSLAGGMKRAAQFMLWVILLLQTLSQAGRSATAGLPPALADLNNALRALTFDTSFAVHPHCVSKGLFTVELLQLASGLLLAVVVTILWVTRDCAAKTTVPTRSTSEGLPETSWRHCCRKQPAVSDRGSTVDTDSTDTADNATEELGWEDSYARVLGKAPAVIEWTLRGALTSLLLVFSLVVTRALEMVHCRDMGRFSLDELDDRHGGGEARRFLSDSAAVADVDDDIDSVLNSTWAGAFNGSATEVSPFLPAGFRLDSNPFVECYSKEHLSVAALAWLILVTIMCAFPVLLLLSMCRRMRKVLAMDLPPAPTVHWSTWRPHCRIQCIVRCVTRRVWCLPVYDDEELDEEEGKVSSLHGGGSCCGRCTRAICRRRTRQQREWFSAQPQQEEQPQQRLAHPHHRRHSGPTLTHLSPVKADFSGKSDERRHSAPLSPTAMESAALVAESKVGQADGQSVSGGAAFRSLGGDSEVPTPAAVPVFKRNASHKNFKDWKPSHSSSAAWRVDAAIVGRVPPGLAPLLDADYRPTFFFLRLVDMWTLALLGALAVFRNSIRGTLGEHAMVGVVIFVLVAHMVVLVLTAPYPGWDEWKNIKVGSLSVVMLSVLLNHLHNMREDGVEWVSERQLETLSSALVGLASLLFVFLFVGFWFVLLRGAHDEEEDIQTAEKPHRSTWDLRILACRQRCCSQRTAGATTAPVEVDSRPATGSDAGGASGLRVESANPLHHVASEGSSRERIRFSTYLAPHLRNTSLLQHRQSGRNLMAEETLAQGDRAEPLRRTFGPAVVPRGRPSDAGSE